MRPKRAAFEACVNLGEYNNEKIRLEADLEENESFADVIGQLREKVLEAATPKLVSIWTDIASARKELKDLTHQLTMKRQEWDQVSEFLRTQGLKPDIPGFPVFNNLLSPAPDIQSERVEEAEFFDEDGEPF